MKATIDKNEIMRWSEKHKGKPALIDDPKSKAGRVGIRLDFPGSDDEALLSDSYPSKNISWDEFFEIFEDQALIFEYEDSIKGDPTTLYRFVNR